MRLRAGLDGALGRLPRRGGGAVAWLLLAALGLGVAWALAAGWTALTPQIRTAFRFRPGLLALAWLIQTPGWLLVVDAWRRILAALRVGPDTGPDAQAEPAAPDALAAISLAAHLQGHTLSALAQVLPGSIWAPLTRVGWYRRRGLGGLHTGTAMLVEMAILGLAGLLLFLATLPFSAAGSAAALPWLLAAAGLNLLALHPAVFTAILAFLSRRLGLDPAPRALPAGLLARLLAQALAVLGLSGLAFQLLIEGLLPGIAHLPTVLAAWGLAVAVASLLAWLPATALLKDGGMVALLSPLCLPLAGGDWPRAAALALGITLAWRLWTLAVLLSWLALASLALRLRQDDPRRVGARP